jgi:hypothetical protein
MKLSEFGGGTQGAATARGASVEAGRVVRPPSQKLNIPKKAKSALATNLAKAVGITGTLAMTKNFRKKDSSRDKSEARRFALIKARNKASQ